MTSRLSLLFILFAAGALQAQPAQDSDAGILGKVGDQVVRIEDVRASLEALAPQDRATAGSDPAVMNKLVRSLLVQNIVLQQAMAKKWDQDASVVPFLTRMKETAITETFLKAQCSPPESYPNDAELQTAYDTARPTLLVPRTYHLAQIFIADPKGESTAPTAATTGKVPEKVSTVQKALKVPGADFAALAGVHSDDRQSAGRGGDLDWLSESQIQPEIRTQLAGLKLNTTSVPIRLNDGWHILKMLDIREPFTPTLDQVRSQLIQQLRTERTRVNTQEYLAKLLQENPIAINELALSKVFPAAKKTK